MNGEIFEIGYEELRKKYVRYLAEYIIPYKKISYHGIKILLSKSTILSVDDNNKAYKLYYSQDDLMKSLASDMLKFRMKSLVHHKDYLLINGMHELSSNWDIVTNYYSAFSYASLLMRLLHRGTIFLDPNTKSIVDRNISNALGEIIQIESNCTFLVNYNDSYIELKKSDGNVHEVVWRETNKILQEMLQFSRSKSLERTVLTQLLDINSTHGVTYPSKIRNMVNYQPELIIQYLEKGFHKVPPLKDPIQNLLEYASKDSEMLDTKIYLYSIYQKYIKMLADRFFKDFLDMVKQNYLIKGYPML